MKGQGVKQSPKKAREWYKKAAANGNNKAKDSVINTLFLRTKCLV